MEAIAGIGWCVIVTDLVKACSVHVVPTALQQPDVGCFSMKCLLVRGLATHAVELAQIAVLYAKKTVVEKVFVGWREFDGFLLWHFGCGGGVQLL